MNAKLDDMDQFVAKKEQELQDKLKDKQQAAIKAIDEKIEKMKEAMAGALSKLGKLLLYAAKKFFTWALEKFGFSLDEIEGIINKGAAVLKAIFTQPIPFVKNLINAAITGFKNFGMNFLTHLKDAVFEWLTGSLVGLILPDRWDLKGILSVIFQMIGITYQNIRSHLVKLIPEPVVKSMETTFTLVKNLITEGPMAAWEQLEVIAGDMKDTFIDIVKGWIKWKVVEEAIKTITSMFIPGAGIIRAIVGIYDTIVFFIKKAKDILQMIGNFLGSIAEIAAGNIAAAAEALENGLARGLTLVIDFLAKFLHLSGITQKIRDVIQNIHTKVDNVIGKVAEWVVGKAKKLWGKVTGKDEKDREKKPDELAPGGPQRIELPLIMNGEEHRLIFITGAQHAVKMASVEDFLSGKIGKMIGSLQGELARERAKGASANPTKITNLSNQATDLGVMRSMVKAAEDAAAAAGSRTPELASTDPAFLTLRSQLQSFSRSWGRSDIADYIIPPEPTPEEIAADPDIATRRAWCRQVDLNLPDSDIARGLFNSRNQTIQSLVDDGVLVGGIKARLPTDAYNLTIDKALRLPKGLFEGVKVRKFVTDQRDKFRGR
jgi:hypothetical protein